MYTVKAKSGEMIHLGREGENLVRKIVFDVSDWASILGDGVAELIAIRTGDAEFYPCEIERDGNTVIWTITNADTAKPGRAGKCVLSYHIDSKLAKSETFQTVVSPSPGNASADPPAPHQGWVDQVLSAGAEFEAERIKAEAAAEQAEAARDEVAGAIEAAAKAEQEAKNAAEAVTAAVAEGVTTLQNEKALCSEMLQAETTAWLESIQNEGTAQVERVGEDYLTAEDKAELVSAVLDALPTYEGDTEGASIVNLVATDDGAGNVTVVMGSVSGTNAG